MAKKKKASRKPKTGYAGGEKVVMPKLDYASSKGYVNGDDSDSFGAVDCFVFHPKAGIVTGHGDCGDGRYVATNKEEAAQLIDFLKACYEIK